MRSYLEANNLPTVKIGPVELPRLIMGIHPYDGCSYVDKARDAANLARFGQVGNVSKVLGYAVEEQGLTVVQVDHMLPDLDRLHLQAIWETERQVNVRFGLIAYILVPILLDGEDITYSNRTHATLYAYDERSGGEAFREHMHTDEIVRYVLGGSWDGLVTPDIVAPFTPDEAARFEIDYAKLEQYLGFFAGFDILVADPGAEIDLLAMTGRFDLISQYVAFLRERYGCVITSVHHAGVTIPLLEREGIGVDAYLTPVNKLGLMMFPTKELVLDAIQQVQKPIIAIKPLAGGRFLGAKAFDFVFKDVDIAAAMFGMGTKTQVRETTTAAKSVLGIQ
jgi:hypothetical protein